MDTISLLEEIDKRLIDMESLELAEWDLLITDNSDSCNAEANTLDDLIKIILEIKKEYYYKG